MTKSIGIMISTYEKPYPSFEVASFDYEDDFYLEGSEANGDKFYCNKRYWRYEPYDEESLQKEAIQRPPEDFDMVGKPKHYQVLPGVEVRDIIKALVAKIEANKSLTAMQVADYVQLMQYLLRFMDKNGDEDLAKAKVYLDWLVESRKGE